MSQSGIRGFIFSSCYMYNFNKITLFQRVTGIFLFRDKSSTSY
uniref:Uncharacterized protein n=1 Tax=Anguilla anguilla TaxID=7936 RepID=A0A0E9VCQ7_ANGAN